MDLFSQVSQNLQPLSQMLSLCGYLFAGVAALFFGFNAGMRIAASNPGLLVPEDRITLPAPPPSMHSYHGCAVHVAPIYTVDGGTTRTKIGYM